MATLTGRLGRAGCVAGALALALSGAGCAPNPVVGGPLAPLPASEHPLEGAPAPDFDLPALTGGNASPSARAGRVVLLDFWATWCEPCRKSFPEYQALSAEYGAELAVVAVSEDDEAAGIDRFVQETGATFPIAWDGDKAVARRYQLRGMPTLFIIDKSGLIRFVHAGFRPGDEGQIRAAIDSLR